MKGGHTLETLFRLIRMPFLPLPLLLWTFTWPLLVAGLVALVIPIYLLGITVWGAIRLPLVFFHAAFSNEPESLNKYLNDWRLEYEEIPSLRKIKIARGYSRILDWGCDPKTVPETGWIVVVANVIAVVLIASIFSELVRTVLWVLGVIIVILFVISLLSD